MAQEMIGIIGGTGLEGALADRMKDIKYYNVATPYGRPSDRIMVGRIGKRRVAFINRHGPGHKFGPSDIPYAANIYAIKKLGVRTVIATAAVGSLRQAIRPGDLVLVSQFIDRTSKRQNSFFAGIAAVHCEMSRPVCERLSGVIIAAGGKLRIHNKATYVCIEGPTFSTRAESLMHRKWGADLVGMTAMPEAKLAREAQICYTLVAMVSDYDCWRPQRKADKQALMREIIGNMKRASDNCLMLIDRALKSKNGLVCENCECRKSLGLAVLTDKSKITAVERRKTAVLFE
ncbi:MAG: S-methyl-5'-thioadenosine phosphorylase [Sedimentisphaerales bacterium]